YNAPGEQQVLVDTIREDFGIAVNHWIEVDFAGFRRLVDAIGGVTLDGEMALAYARSRKAEYHTEDGWVRDPQSDLSRIARQQTLMTEALSTALDEAGSNPLRVRELIDIGVDNVTIDERLGLGDIRQLADRFSDLDPANFRTVALPVVPRPGDEGATVVMDEAAAEPILAVFRGGEAREVDPSEVTVDVRNGTMADGARRRDGLAGEVTTALEGVGFTAGTPADDDEFHEHTTVRYAPGEVAYGQAVARRMADGVVLEEDPEVESGHVTVVAGADFTSVRAEPVPLDELPPPPEGDPSSSGAAAGLPPAGADGDPASDDGEGTDGTDGGTRTTIPTGPTTTTPAQVGAVPPGAC
ncbi:MAG TPA: LCP family protein, partial [Acidimicrobiales bacterium]|nr:LCP family protein [Acidimicrobiales bacterium]